MRPEQLESENEGGHTSLSRTSSNTSATCTNLLMNHDVHEVRSERVTRGDRVPEERETDKSENQEDGEGVSCLGSRLSLSARFGVGVLLFVAVDVLWVASAAATKYLFDEDEYKKPLFTLYFKTSLFVLYLLGIPFIPSWRALASKSNWRPVDDLAQGDDDEYVDGDDDDDDDDDDGFINNGFDTSAADDNMSFGRGQDSPSIDSSPSLSPTNRHRGINMQPVLSEVNEDGSLSASSGECSPQAGLTMRDVPMSPCSENGDAVTTPSRPFCQPRESTTSADGHYPPHSESARTSVSKPSPMKRSISQVSTSSVASLKSCLKRSDSSSSLVEVPALPPTMSRPSLSSSRFTAMPLHHVPEQDEEVVEEIPDGEDSQSQIFVRSKRSSKVKFNVAREVRVMPGAEYKDANYARRSFEQAEELRETARRRANRIPLRETAKLAFFFVFLWFIANYFYQLAFIKTSVATVNILSSTSALFVLVLSAFLPGDAADRFNITKFFVVLLCCSGVVMVGYSDSAAMAANSTGKASAKGNTTAASRGITVDTGILYTLAGAFFYATYVVMLKRRVRYLDRLVVPVFFGFVGLWCLIFLWPLLFIFHYSHAETFVLPQDFNGTNGTNYIWPVLIVNGLVGTVVSEVLWLVGVFLTSPLVGTMALVLVNPLSLLYSLLGKGLTFDALYGCGAALVTMAFLLVAYLGAKQADPLGKLLLRLKARLVAARARSLTFKQFDDSS